MTALHYLWQYDPFCDSKKPLFVTKSPFLCDGMAFFLLVLTWPSWIRASWYNYESNQQDATIYVNLLFLVSSTCFGWCFRSSSGALNCIYSIWWYSPKLLTAGVMDEFSTHPWHQLAAAILGSLRVNHSVWITESEKCKPACHCTFLHNGWRVVVCPPSLSISLFWK